jgi:hypothetical protein
LKTLLLAVDTWDLCLDAAGNLAVATDPYGLAQDVSSAIKTFLGEVWYNDELGIDYFGQILGHAPPITYFQAQMVAAALGARPNTADVYVVSAVCVINSFDASTRTVLGEVDFVDNLGNSGSVPI